MKAIDLINYCATFARYHLLGCLKQAEYDAVTSLLDVIAACNARSITQNSADQLVSRADDVLHHFHDVCPRTEHSIVFHLLSHFTRDVAMWGPGKTFDMFSLER